MKTKFLRVSLLILAFSLVIGAAAAMVISANSTAAAPEIISQNIKYTDQFLLMYAVKKDTVTDPENLKLNIYDKNPEDPEATLIRTYTEYKEEAADSAKNNLSADSYVFTTDGVAATAFLQELYVQAACGTQKSAVKKYSVAEYLYERLASGDLNQKQAQFYTATLDFGASAHKVVGGATAETKLVTDYSYVEVVDGTIGGISKGLYAEGTVLSIDGEDAWYLTTYDAIGDFKISQVTDRTFAVADGIKNKLTKKAIDYRDDIETLNDLTVGKVAIVNKYTSDNRFHDFANNAPGVEYVYSGDHAVVTKLNISDNGDSIKIMPTDTSVAAADAKAFECSFDIKMTTPGSKNMEPIEIFFLSNTSSRFRTNLYARDNGLRDYLRVNSASGTMERKYFNDIDPTDWINIRVVIYANDLTQAYFYIDGSTEAMVHKTAGGEVDFTKIGVGIRQYTAGYYTKEVDSDGDGVKETVSYGNEGEQVTVLLDNYYCGYTMEENPYVATEVTEQ